MINNNCTCHGCHNICVFQLVFSIYIIYRLLKRVYCINIYTTSINRKILSSKKLKRTNKPQRIQATTMQSIFPFVFVFFRELFSLFSILFFFQILKGKDPSSRKRAISCGMTALSSTAVHGLHMQSTGARVTTCKKKKGIQKGK